MKKTCIIIEEKEQTASALFNRMTVKLSQKNIFYKKKYFRGLIQNVFLVLH